MITVKETMKLRFNEQVGILKTRAESFLNDPDNQEDVSGLAIAREDLEVIDAYLKNNGDVEKAIILGRLYDWVYGLLCDADVPEEKIQPAIWRELGLDYRRQYDGLEEKYSDEWIKKQYTRFADKFRE